MKGNSSPQTGFTVKIENNGPQIKSRMTLSYIVAVVRHRFYALIKGSDAVNYEKFWLSKDY